MFHRHHQQAPETTPGIHRYLMREKLLALRDNYHIENEQRQRVFHVDGKLLRLRDTLLFKDMQSHELLKIQKKWLSALCWLLEASAEKMEGLNSSVTSSLNTSHARKASSSENLSHCSVKRSYKEGQTPLVWCIHPRKTAKKDRRYATSQVKRVPPNGITRFFPYMEELKHFGDTRGIIHPGLARRGSCHHRDLVEQAHQIVLEAVV